MSYHSKCYESILNIRNHGYYVKGHFGFIGLKTVLEVNILKIMKKSLTLYVYVVIALALVFSVAANVSQVVFAAEAESSVSSSLDGGGSDSSELAVGKYASVEVSATDDFGNSVVDITSADAKNYSGIVTLNISLNEMLKAVKKPTQEYGDIRFTYFLSLPEPLEWKSDSTLENNSSLVAAADVKIADNQKNKIVLSLDLKKDMWEKLYESSEDEKLLLTSRYTFTKNDADKLVNHYISGNGDLSIERLSSFTPEEYVTDEVNLPLFGGSPIIERQFDNTKEGYDKLVYGDALAKTGKDIQTNTPFTFSNTAKNIVYEEFDSPLLSKNGVQMNTTVSTQPFKDSLDGIERWLKSKINDLERVHIGADFNVELKVSFKFPKEMSLASKKELPENPSLHYPSKIGGVTRYPTKLVGSSKGFYLKETYEKDDIMTATIRLDDWWRGSNQLLKPSSYPYSEVRKRIKAAADEINIAFTPVYFNASAEPGKRYEIVENIQAKFSGRIAYAWDPLNTYHLLSDDASIPFNVAFNQSEDNSFAEAPYSVSFAFQSGTPGKELPYWLPKRYALKDIHVYKGETYTLNDSDLRLKETDREFHPYDELDDDGTKITGTWVFDASSGWKVNGEGEPITHIDNVSKNINLVGTWIFTPAEKSSDDPIVPSDSDTSASTPKPSNPHPADSDTSASTPKPSNPQPNLAAPLPESEVKPQLQALRGNMEKLPQTGKSDMLVFFFGASVLSVVGIALLRKNRAAQKKIRAEIGW